MTQAEVDKAVIRIRRLVERYGPQAERLASVRALYKMFKDCPEDGAFGLLEAALADVEAQERAA